MSEEWNNNEIQPELTQTKKETDRKCPDCGGTMDYDPATGGLSCPYCGRKEVIDAPKDAKAAKELDFESAEETGNCNWGVAKKVVICKSCGAESVYDALEIASECPYCGSNQVMEAQGKNTLAPGGVCPFKIEKKDAGARFKKWIKGKWFCPKDAKESAKPESFQGVYIPAWTFDADSFSTYTARYGKNRTVKSADGKSSRIVVDWFNTRGTYEHSFNDRIVYGSERYDNGILNSILPFHTEENVEYKPEYVAGFAAERYSVGLKSAWAKAKAAMHSFLESSVTSNIKRERNADQVSQLNLNTEFSNITYKYLLLPVWISSFTYKGKAYQFMVNGQTGEVGGRTPISWIKVLITILIILLILALFYFMLG